MRLVKLSIHNFKKSFQNYFSMILSLAFTVLIIFNFINLLYADAFTSLVEKKSYIESIVNVLAFVLWCFTFFFVWYASNVFLVKRKKEIGIFVFMGLTNQRIGRLYALEMVMIGAVALVLGIVGGLITTHLFQMTLLAISEITVELSFHFEWKPVLITALIYVAIYAVFVIKGYVSIVRSSVLEMISAARQNEYVRTNMFILFVKTLLGIVILSNGYHLAVKDSGMQTINNLFIATALVIAGIYLIFGGFLPFMFRYLAGRKAFLYAHERNLWVNNVIFRMKKNYRTYAMTCVLLTCAVTALAASFAAKGQYDGMVNFRNTYTYQIVTNRAGIGEEAEKLINKDNEVDYHTEIQLLQLDNSQFSDGYSHGILAFSEVKRLAETVGLSFPYDNMADDETVFLNHIYLLSLYIFAEKDVGICGKAYRQIDESAIPYLGYLQEHMSFYMVSDTAYEEIKSVCEQENIGKEIPLSAEVYAYNYRIKDIYNFAASLDELDKIMLNTETDYTGLVRIDPYSDDIRWIKLEYSLCVFVFLVFVIASGSILFMKLYNDAFEEKERYAVLHKIGIRKKEMAKAITKELRVAYVMPFLFMTLSSYFSVHSLEKMMSADLKMINLVSVIIIFVFFAVFYKLSVIYYRKNAGIG